MNPSRLAWCLGLTALLAAASAAPAADSFTIRADWFDRGNVDNRGVARGYSDKFPCIVNAGPVPNVAEYDIEFPVTADYTLRALYAAQTSRPVKILLDGKLLAEGIKEVTGSWSTSRAKWFEETTARIAKGKHTIRLQRADCIPHICALRFESPVAFPKGWVLDRRAFKKAKAAAVASKKDQPGFVGFYTLNPPDSYDYRQPHDNIPLPTPRAHRVLEYALIPGTHKVEARIEQVGSGAKADAGAKDPTRNELLVQGPRVVEASSDWVAHLSVKLGAKRAERDTLSLSPAHLRKMVDHTLELILNFRDLPGVAADYLAKEGAQAAHMGDFVGALLKEKDSEAKWQRFYALYVEAYKLKNRVALSNPLIDFASVVLAKRLTYNTSHIYTIYYDGSGRWKAGSGMFSLSPVRPDGKLTCLTPTMKPDGIYRDTELSWDGEKVLFSFKPDPKSPYRIYEMNVDGSGLKALTNSKYDDVDPCYMADGRIAFISTRSERVTLCHNAFTVSNLYTMDADGKNVRCNSTNTIHDFTPSVLADGQLAVSQWRYVDKHVGNNQSLWRCNPDGTRMVHVAGAHFGPVTFWGARQVPGSQRIACVLGPHMPYAVGPVALVDPMWTHSSPQVYTNLTPEIPPPSHASWQRPQSGFYADVFPLSDDYFLVSYCYGPDNRDPMGYAIYLLDRWNNRDLVYRDAELSAFEPFPVAPRPEPTTISPSEKPVVAAPRHADPASTDWGTFYVLDVYQGLDGIPAGEVKYIRVTEEIPKPVSSRTRGHRLQNPAISDSGHFALKRLWGTVPVEADGSAHFKAPANKAIYFSALDADFMEVQRMRTFFTAAPNERVGCVGCHERKTTSPRIVDALALRREPSDITPPADGGVHAPDFYYDVQPVLNKHCVQCHGGAAPKGGVDLSPDYTNLFNVAYETLVRRGLTSYANIYQISTLLTRPPKYYGSHASKVVQVVRTTHKAKKRVNVPPEDWRRFVTWIDSNAPYYGTYTYMRPNTAGGREIFARQKGAMGDVHKRRCATCHGGSPEPKLFRIRLDDLAQTRALLAPLAKAAGGAQSCKQIVFADKADPDYQKLAALYAQVKAECEQTPRVDMRDTRPPATDPKCRYVYRPGVVREYGQSP